VNTWFENFIYTLILLSMILLVLDNPMNDPNSHMTQVLGKLDMGITLAFTLEAIARIIASGFYWSSV